MIEEHAVELRGVIRQLASGVGELGLTHAEVATLLDLPDNGWPLDVARQWSPELTVWQETCLRRLTDVCNLVRRARGADAARWLRDPDTAAGISPLAYLMSDDAALGALRNALRAAQETVR